MAPPPIVSLNIFRNASMLKQKNRPHLPTASSQTSPPIPLPSHPLPSVFSSSPRFNRHPSNSPQRHDSASAHRRGLRGRLARQQHNTPRPSRAVHIYLFQLLARRRTLKKLALIVKMKEHTMKPSPSISSCRHNQHASAVVQTPTKKP